MGQLLVRENACPDGNACKWEIIRYALDSNAQTVRLCLIFLAVSTAPTFTLITLLIRR